MSDPYKTFTVHDKTLTIPEDGIENTSIIDRATKAPGVQDNYDTSGDTHNTRKLSQSQTNEAKNKYSNQFVLDKIFCNVTENGDTKNIARLDVYPYDENPTEPASYLSEHLTNGYWRMVNHSIRQNKSL